MKRRLYALVLACLLIGLSACKTTDQSTSETKPPILRLGIVPFETGEELLKEMQPLIDVIEKGMDMEVQATVAGDYTGVVEAFKNDQLDVAFLSPAAYVLAAQEANVRVILQSVRDNHAHFYGAIITHRDSGINSLKDLKGKTFAFGDPISTSGHIFARKMMLEANINPETDLEKYIYAGSHDATILAVLNRKVDAGATYSDDKEGKSTSWSRFLDAKDQDKIKLVTMTEPIPSDTICVSKDYSPELTERLRKTIMDFTDSPEGHALVKKLYKFDSYQPASSEDYKSVRDGFAAAGMDLKETLRKNK